MRDTRKEEVDKVSSGQKQFWQSCKWNPRQTEELQTWGRSTQERIGNRERQVVFDHLRRAAALSAPGMAPGPASRSQDFSQLPIRKALEADLTYAIALPKCHNDVVRA